MQPMQLHYLSFETTDEGGDVGAWDAVACVSPDRVAAVQAEVDVVLGWIGHHIGQGPAPLDEGGLWDMEQSRWPEDGRVTLTLTITGPMALGLELARAFQWD